MKSFKKIIAIFMVAVLTFSLMSCSENKKSVTAGVSNGEYKIGVLQLIQHQALDLTYQGFEDYLRESGIKVDIDYQNASGEQSACETIAEKFLNDNLDLCYAIATPAAESVLAKLSDVPIVAAAVTDPASSGLCETNDHPGGMLTAASDLTPVEAQFDLLMELIPDAKNVGILYCSAESNSKIQADMAIAASNKRGLLAKEYTVVSSSDIQTVVESMIGKVDVIYVPTDNVVSSGFDTVVTIANENKIPTIVGEEAMVDKGGLATYGINYYSLGKIAGEMAYEILVNGKKPSEMPVRYLDSNLCERKINADTASLLGIEAR